MRVEVLRIVPHIGTRDMEAAHKFYGERLGLDTLMDHGWLRPYANTNERKERISIAEGGSGLVTPDHCVWGLMA